LFPFLDPILQEELEVFKSELQEELEELNKKLEELQN